MDLAALRLSIFVLISASQLVGCGDSGTGVLEISARTNLVKFEHNEGTRKVVISLLNRGDAPLQISGIQTSCGCATADGPTQFVLASKQTLPLTLNVNSPGFGSKRVSVTVRTDSVVRRETRFTFDVHGPELKVPFVVPETLQVRTAIRRQGIVASAQIEIDTWESSGSEHWINGLAGIRSAVRVESDGDPSEFRIGDKIVRRRYRFTLLTDGPHVPLKTERHRLSIITTSPSMKPIPAIVFETEFVAPIQVLPSELSFVNRRGSSTGGRVVLIAEDELRWDAEILEPIPEGFEVERLSETSTGQFSGAVFRVAMSPDQAFRDETKRLILKIRTSHPDMPLIEVPLTIRRSPG